MNATVVLLLLALMSAPPSAPWCGLAKVTGYVRSEGNAFTYDGSSIYTDEAIVAASYDVAMGATVEIEGLGTFRVADRGHLGNGNPTWIDVAVHSRAEAYALTGEYQICVR